LRIDTGTGYALTCQDLLAGTGYRLVVLWKWSDLDSPPQVIHIDDTWLPDWKSAKGPFPPNVNYALMFPERIVCGSHGKDDTLLIVRDIKGTREFKRWSAGKKWDCKGIWNTWNGKFAALCLKEKYEYVLKDKSRTHEGRFRLGLVDSQAEEVRWVSTVYRKESLLPNISAVAISEDGKYLAAVGTNEGGFIHMADVEQKKPLWEKVPMGKEVPMGDWTVNFNDVCFSPDSKYAYVAGNVGFLCFDVATGTILSQWPIPGRCMSVAVSPDGRLVAGGTEGSDWVYVYEARTGRLLLRIKTRQFSTYGLAFSPDSKLLATSGVKNTNIKIWKMPSVALQTREMSKANANTGK
jgi:WD40 repeat protein